MKEKEKERKAKKRILTKLEVHFDFMSRSLLSLKTDYNKS